MTTGLPGNAAPRSGSRRSARGRRGWRARSPTASCSTGARPSGLRRPWARSRRVPRGRPGSGVGHARRLRARRARARVGRGGAEARPPSTPPIPRTPAVRELGFDPTDAAARRPRRHGDARVSERRVIGSPPTGRRRADLPVVYPVVPGGATDAAAARATLRGARPELTRGPLRGPAPALPVPGSRGELEPAPRRRGPA